MAGGGGRFDEKDEKRKEGEEECYNNRNRGNKRKYRKGVEEWLEREVGMKVNIKEAFKINKGKMMLAKLGQKKNIMLNKSKLKERKGERMYIDDDLTNEERKTLKKLREMAREEREVKEKRPNRIQEDTDKRGMVYMG
jgi:hypothetical protein